MISSSSTTRIDAARRAMDSGSAGHQVRCLAVIGRCCATAGSVTVKRVP